MKKKLESLVFGLIMFILINAVLIMHALELFFSNEPEHAEKVIMIIGTIVMAIVSLIFLL